LEGVQVHGSIWVGVEELVYFFVFFGAEDPLSYTSPVQHGFHGFSRNIRHSYVVYAGFGAVGWVARFFWQWNVLRSLLGVMGSLHALKVMSVTFTGPSLLGPERLCHHLQGLTVIF